MDPRLNRKRWLLLPLVAVVLAASGIAHGQSLYKYRDDNGEWVYADRPPAGSEVVEVRRLSVGPTRSTVTVSHELAGNDLRVTAHNSFHVPVEVALVFNAVSGVEFPGPANSLRWVVQPRSELMLLSLAVSDDGAAPQVDYDWDYMPGDPAAVHHPGDGYRAPFAAAGNYSITQAFPDNVTHLTADSEHAIDIAMPVGTDVLAARGGVVFEVIGTNFRGGFNRQEHLRSANIVRILHDDGTFAVYAHLNWDSIRVRPGERVRAGQYIADSGNTGYSSGPHLHFAVQHNAGMRIEALPVAFRGASSGRVVPATGNVLTGYP